jgi:predicted lipoprotein with Yx(FWY)xxD motif
MEVTMSNGRPRRLIATAAVAAVGVLLVAWSASAATPHAAKQGTGVTVGSTAIGRILINTSGHTLYMYTPDKKNKSTCYGQCAAFWPPLLTSGTPHGGHGVKARLLGTTKRRDGKLQVTYAGHPLYLFAQDEEPADVNGQGLQDIWYAVSVTGARVTTPPPAATVQLAQNALGSILVDSRGMTLYMFTPDTSTTSACYEQCSAAWPPLLLNGKLRAAAGLQTSLLGTLQRTDGTRQVTYAGHPLYFFAKDTKPGDTNGQGLFTKWYVLSASGTPIGAS